MLAISDQAKRLSGKLEGSMDGLCTHAERPVFQGAECAERPEQYRICLEILLGTISIGSTLG